MKENNSLFPPGFLSMTDLLHLLHTETNPGLDVVVFIGTTQFLSSQLETPLLQKMKYKDVSRLLRRTDDFSASCHPESLAIYLKRISPFSE
ncbi:hypothetical protein [Paenibacillus sp. UNCCL52]|uniref:hypothetical protein n=1 Tax=Paenibacillus sp. UNCCL52 TaxID=1449064 RepID=UPI0008F04B03|nr:hypothetical protein [Paenibacillus sp. UNCCL52]SFQ99226.1 hypothetical protein SAMN04488603_101575 [Paenibacillus sp. cl130]